MASKVLTFIKQNKHLPDCQICKHLNIGQKKLNAIRYWNDIEKEFDRGYSEDDELYIKTWHGKKTNEEIGQHLGRTRQAIADKIRHMKQHNQF